MRSIGEWVPLLEKTSLFGFFSKGTHDNLSDHYSSFFSVSL